LVYDMSPELIGDSASTSMASTRPLLNAYLRAADRPVAPVKRVRRGVMK
jgi:hypothetical protein